jgi:hypothetical protein
MKMRNIDKFDYLDHLNAHDLDAETILDEIVNYLSDEDLFDAFEAIADKFDIPPLMDGHDPDNEDDGMAEDYTIFSM